VGAIERVSIAVGERRIRPQRLGSFGDVALGLFLLLLMYAAWQVSRWPAVDRTLVGDAFVYPVGLAAIAAAVGASRRCRERSRQRFAWLVLAVASAVYLAGDITQTAYELAGSKPYPSVADALYLRFTR
jgi:hypothetical protein